MSAAKKLKASQTIPERMLGAALREKYADLFLAQWAIGEFVVDFYCPLMLIAVEVDGPSHRRAATVARDELQEGSVEALGGVTIRFSNDEVTADRAAVVDRIHRVVLERLDWPISKNARAAHGWRLPKNRRRQFEAERAG